jgi:hypothetical protein
VGEGFRTPNPQVHSLMLYPLSYTHRAIPFLAQEQGKVNVHGMIEARSGRAQGRTGAECGRDETQGVKEEASRKSEILVSKRTEMLLHLPDFDIRDSNLPVRRGEVNIVVQVCLTRTLEPSNP